MKRVVALTAMVLVLTGCLENLNQTEFFRKLKIKSPEHFALVVKYRSRIEASILATAKTKANSTIKKITYWGEGRWATGKVIIKRGTKTYFVQRGIISKSDGKDYPYAVVFDVDRDGSVKIIEFL